MVTREGRCIKCFWVYVACVNKTFCGIFRTGINEQKGMGDDGRETIKLRYTLCNVYMCIQYNMHI